LEYCFFQSYSKGDLAHLYLISNLITEQRPKETITKLVYLYITYKYFEEIYSFDEVQNVILDISSNLILEFSKEVCLLALDVARRAAKSDDEAELLAWFRNDQN